MNHLIKKEALLVLFCFIIGFALRIYTFDQKSLWLDEIYTFQDSRYGIKEQLEFYKENPTHNHPPLFFILTHLFYPFENPERELRVIPLIFGVLSIPMIYLLAGQFSSNIALPCAGTLTFMTYHIYLSQDGRSYSLLLFLGMVGLYFFMKYLNTFKKIYLPITGLFYSLIFYTSYSSIPFIVFSQMLWLYRKERENKSLPFSSILVLNGILFLFLSPWIIFLSMNYKGQEIMHSLHTEGTGSLIFIFYGILHDWMPQVPLMIVSMLLIILFPILAKEKVNAIILFSISILPVVGLYFFCKLFNITHFITSRYFINLFPIFIISIFLSIESIEARFNRIRSIFRLPLLFMILFIVSNLILLPLYYSSEKQDLRGLVTYLKGQIREGDSIYVTSVGYIPAMLHYFNIHPKNRYHLISVYIFPKDELVYTIQFSYQGKLFSIFSSKTFGKQYIKDGGRLWIVLTKPYAKLMTQSSFVFKGYFDGSFLNFNRFPTDASLYLFLWDPSSPDEKGINIPIE